MSMLRQTPFLRLFVPLATGIGSGFWLSGIRLSSFFLSIVLSVLLILLISLYTKARQHYGLRWMYGVIAFLFLFFCGFLLYDLSHPKLISDEHPLEAYGIAESFEVRENGWSRMIMKPLNVFLEGDLVNDFTDGLWMVMVKGELENDIQPGTLVFVSGTLRELPAASNPEAFDYGRYLARNGFSGQMFIRSNDLQVLESTSAVSLRLIAADVREGVSQTLHRFGVSDANLPVISALLLGNRQGLDRETTEQFIRSGAIHILAVSGLHVGILFLMINAVLALFFSSRHPARIVISISLLFIYAFITGFSPSVSRAVLMFAILQVGRAFNREANMYNLLCVSAFILLICNPMFLFHAGFWLSHLAVAGIVAFYPVINGLVTFRFIVWRWLWSILSVSLAAQITTFPYSIYMFGAFPLYFLLANVFVLPVVAPILIFAFLVLMLQPFTFLAHVTGGLLNALIDFMVAMVSWIEGLPGAYAEYLWFSLPLMVALYALVFFLYRLYVRPSWGGWLRLTVTALFVCVIANVQFVSKASAHSLVVYDAGKHILIDIIHNGSVSQFYSEGLDDRAKRYARDGFIRSRRLRDADTHILKSPGAMESAEVIEFEAGGLTYMIVNGNGTFTIPQTFKYRVDCLILNGALRVEPEVLLSSVECSRVVLATDCPPWMLVKWEAMSSEKGVNLHNVRKHGAFVASN